MWVEIHTAVIAVPEIEVPIEHQHFVALQILERLLASLVPSIHVCKGVGPDPISGFTYTVRP